MFFYQVLIKFQCWRLPQILSKPSQCILPSRLVSESKGENNVERPSRTSCPDGYNFWHLEPCRLSCWLWGADSFYFGCGFVSVAGEGIANGVCPLQLSLLSMLGSSKVQRKVVYYCMWVAEGQIRGLWILMHGSVVSELTAVFWKLSLEQIRLFQSKCSSSEDNNNQMICVNPSLHKHLKGLNVREHLCPHFWHNIGKISALWDCPCKLPPKSL